MKRFITMLAAILIITACNQSNKEKSSKTEKNRAMLNIFFPKTELVI